MTDARRTLSWLLLALVAVVTAGGAFLGVYYSPSQPVTSLKLAAKSTLAATSYTEDLKQTSSTNGVTAGSGPLSNESATSPIGRYCLAAVNLNESPLFEIFPADGVAKCVPKTTTLVSAYFSQNARRVFFAIAPSESKASSHSGYLH